ncbi:MAG: amino acid ABC transporter substrate-binding protein [Rubrivivax sp.]|nr:amino acid ABC transporter substrate-binding protein [Rubrivivax sp.]
MRKALYAATLVAALSAGAVQADTLARIKETGAVTMGVRESSGALSYQVAEGQYTGFHVEICQRVLADVQRRLGLPNLDIGYRVVSSQNRIPLLLNGSIDIECGSTTNSTQRRKDAAFAVTTFVEETRFAVKADSGIGSLVQLKGKRVSTTTGTTAVQVMRQQARAAGIEFRPVYGKDHGDSFLLLRTGRADAFVMDSQILAGLISQAANPADYTIVGEVLSVEPIAIMMRKDDPAFKRAVDDSIVAMMKSGEISRLYERWFMQPIPPANKRLGLPASDATRAAWAEPNDKPAEDYRKK